MTTDLTSMDETKPDGATEPVSVLDNYDREIRKNLKDWGGTEHQVNGGRHKIPYGVTANRPTTLLGAGVLYINTTTGVIEYYDGATWQAGLTVFPAGTRMVFDQDAAPTGWTRDTTVDDRMILITGGARAHGGTWDLSSQITLGANTTEANVQSGSGNTVANAGHVHVATVVAGWRPLKRDMIIAVKD